MVSEATLRTMEWRKNNREKYNAQVRRMRARHKEKHVAASRRLKKLAKENAAGRVMATACEVCGAESTLCLDHCHTTGIFRGWLCHSCNLALGHVKDNTETLRKLACYLEKVSASNP